MAQLININSTEFRRCNLSAIQSGGTWANIFPEENEIILISTANALTADGSGKCDAYIKGDGTKTAALLDVMPITPELYIDSVEVSTFAYGLLAPADGHIAAPGNTDYLYTEPAIPISKNTEITLLNPTRKTLAWIRIFYFNNGTFVRYANVKTSASSDAQYVYNVAFDGTFNEARFSTSQGDSSPFASTDVLSATYPSSVTLKDVVEGLQADVSEMQEELDTEIASIQAEIGGVEANIINTIKNDGELILGTWTKGQYISTNGEFIINGNPQLATTGLIELPYGVERIEMVDIYATVVALQYAFYTSDGNYISGGTGSITTIPSNAKYIRFCSRSYDEDYSTAGYKFFVFNEEIQNLPNDNGRLATATDIEANEKFYIENGSLFGTRASSDGATYCLFKENITAIEFEIATLWDNNLITLAFGDGVDNEDVECVACAYLATSVRTGENGNVRNANSATPQPNSIWGVGRFSGQYRQPQLPPPDMAVGNKCRIELINGTFFRGTYWNTTENKWCFWFFLDTLGNWYTPNRYGWNQRKRIGFAFLSGTGTAKIMANNIRVICETGQITETLWNNAQNYPQKRNWVAIGDSITEINDNNGLSYVGFVERALNWSCNNQGKGGWTIYKLWRDRASLDWENAVSALSDNDVITFFAGGNDFDTKSFSTPASDTAMDSAANPHPRFGTTDPTSADAKDTHTTLGCLRLIIERILTLKPNARLFVFSPIYREKGTLNGSTGWEKDLYINSDGKTIYDYADAIYSVAREYNLPAYNTCRDCGINIQTLATYTYDDLHIGQLGGELLGEYVAKRIKP